MCSVDPDEITEMVHATGALDISRGDVLCRKCGESAAEVVLRVKDAYCRLCFLSYFVHKFRSTIGKSKQIHAGDRVLVATSGGASSTALLHMIREGLNENSHKKLRFDPAFLYIDESCISENPSIGPDYIQKICNTVISMGFQCYVTSLQEVMLPSACSPVLFTKEWSAANLAINSSLTEKIRELLASCKSISAQHDLHEQLRHELIMQCAHDLSYQKVFLAHNSTKLSISILSLVAVGRGSQLPRKVHFRSLHHDVEVFRPMREILEPEVQHYIRFHNLTELQAPTLKSKGPSIVSCTEEFVLGLQKEFPATVPTIFRTGDKLVSTSSDCSKCSTPSLNGDADCESEMDLSTASCALCCSPLDTGQSEASAFYATVVSEKLSASTSVTHAFQETVTHRNMHINDEKCSPLVLGNLNKCCEADPSHIATETLKCSQNPECCAGGKLQEITKEVMEQYLCYGCRIILREMDGVNHLPVKARAAAVKLERQKCMRKQIQDFLI